MKRTSIEEQLGRLAVKQPSEVLDRRVRETLGLDPGVTSVATSMRDNGHYASARLRFDRIAWQRRVLVRACCAFALLLMALGLHSWFSSEVEVLSVPGELPGSAPLLRVLADESRLLAFPGTKVAWQVNKEARKVVLYEGQVELQVSRNGRPFLVWTPSGEIAVVGTHFRVKVYRNIPREGDQS